MGSEQLQKSHYDKIALQYEAHYGDPLNQKYRAKFIYDPMFEGLNLCGMKVLEAMCGSGQTTEYLLAKGASVTGLDISTESINAFQERWPECDAMCASMLDSKLESESFDCVVVVGGLHHLHPHLGEAITEIHRVLKTGGYFCFAEPHSGSLPDSVRRRWYRHDKFFAANEASIDVEGLKKEFAAQFEFKMEDYLGNVAYLLVFNSLIFRIPLPLKPLYTPTLMKMESLVNKLQGKFLSCFVVSQWRKR
jgi:SAM-dependent methyltransferase